MFQKVDEARFIEGEHEMLRLWRERDVFRQLIKKNAGGPKWSFLDGPITANNPMGVHHAWGRTYKDAYQRYFAMTGHELRYQNGFDCQGLWVEVEVEKELGLGTKTAIVEKGIDTFVRECKKRVLRFAARQTEQSIRLGYWMEWDDPDELRKLADAIGRKSSVQSPVSSEKDGSTSSGTLDTGHSTLDYTTARGQEVTGDPEDIVARLGNPEWGGSYFTFSTENNETIWTFLKKCFERKKIYLGHDVMPWGGRAGSAYSQMEIADGRRLTTHRSCFVRFPIIETPPRSTGVATPVLDDDLREYLLVWTTTPWTLTSNVACAVNPDLEYVRVKAQLRGDDEPAYYYFAKDNLDSKRLEREYKEGFGRPEWQWPDGLGKLKTIAQIFKEQGGYEVEGTLKGEEMIGWRYEGPFDELAKQSESPAVPHWPVRTFEPALFLSDPKFLFDSNFDESWATSITESTIESLRSGIRVLVGLVATSLKFIDALFRLRSIPDGYEHWSGVRRLDFALKCGGVHGIVQSLPPEVRRFTDVLFDFIDFSNDAQIDDPPEYLTEQLTREIATADELMKVGRKVHEQVASMFRSIRLQRENLAALSSAEGHRVIDGGRDSKGGANVVAGEGTGIVHTAPGCGDVDFKIGQELGLVSIAPLQEDGSFGEGFGPFTGRKAVDPETADLVFEELKRKGLLVYVETYPHIYPHCWRTGEELVFRLVDEWFINMDWREEIKDVTRCIEWLPEAIQGQEREVEWLSTMRDWMISKKRFWGLALPIWVNPNDATDFKVVGDLDELKRLATNGGEGWDQFEGHTPHRPWIDAVKIPSDKHPGQLLTRVEDVGNPWLDAGIVPFSTLNYNAWKESSVQSRVSSVKGGERRAEGGEPREGRSSSAQRSILDDQPSTLNPQPSTINWPDWYPADFVVESFPGQFRNWFYSLLALSTMMRYDETDDPREKRPFKSLLGHRLVMDETGKPMHKSDGTAIWFEEAADQLGVDTLRWMYLAQNPAADLRFGTRHPDQPVELRTPDGPITETKEGVPTCKVTSKPADEIRRQVLIPLWNSYAFFINYAVADEFDPTLEQVPLAARPEIDRWVLSRLQELTATAHDSFRGFDAARFMGAAEKYIDDLSNWYIRRNRRRFWRSRGEPATGGLQTASGELPTASGGRQSPDGGGSPELVEAGERSTHQGANAPRSPGWEADKLAAYQSLYEVLVTLTKLLAPCVPFLSERMYQNLAASGGRESPDGGGSPEIVEAGERSTHRGVNTPRSPESVHLCDYPNVDESKLDPELNWRTQQVQTLVRLAHRLRETVEQRVRQPLAELRFACADQRQAAALEQSTDIIADELNVKAVTRADNLDDLVKYLFKPNLKTLGPKYGKLLGAIRKELPEIDAATMAPLRDGNPVTLTLGGEDVTLEPDDVLISTEQASDWASGDDGGIQVALSTALTPELVREGMARDFVRHIQQARKNAGLDITDRIRVNFATKDSDAEQAVGEWSDYIRAETLADAIERIDTPSDAAREVTIGDSNVHVSIERA